MDVSTTIRVAQAVEDVAGDLYALLARRSAADAALAAVFHRLELEEREHAQRLQMLGSMYLKDPKSFRGAQLEIPNLEALLAEAKAFHDAVAQGTVEVAEAVPRLVELEERYAVTHAEAVARTADPGVKMLFQMLATQDREHAALLRNRGVKTG